MSGYLIVGSIIVAVLLIVPILARAQARAQSKRNGWIQCDLCDELMRPDGLHINESFSLFPRYAPRIFRHSRHIIRTEILKQPIYGDPKQQQRLKAAAEARNQ